ncbi:MAG: hypothetical protein KAH32_07645 [Chlamydiia bacterium]|nr:hypothetical protein [Chlamydiia bacterium]
MARTYRYKFYNDLCSCYSYSENENFGEIGGLDLATQSDSNLIMVNMKGSTLNKLNPLLYTI